MTNKQAFLEAYKQGQADGTAHKSTDRQEVSIASIRAGVAFAETSPLINVHPRAYHYYRSGFCETAFIA